MNSPSAVTFRDSLSSDAEYARIDEMQPLDIVNSSKQWAKTRCLLQFGLNDPYIDETATAAADTLASDHRVEWLEIIKGVTSRDHPGLPCESIAGNPIGLLIEEIYFGPG